jgi:hypothetical protein
MTDKPVGNSSSHRFTRLALAPASHVFLILLAGLLGYANTFHLPFMFDDNRVILDNHLIKNLGALWPPTGSRWFGNLTFALNYAFGGLTVISYHIVNLMIHLATALLVYCFTILTLRTPLFENNRPECSSHTDASLLALVAGLLFVAHPIQTQAVTYIAQRYASLATLLFVASLICYVRSRLATFAERRPAAMAWYAAALATALLAMKSKEIAFTLPLIAVLYEITFFSGRRRSERFRALLPMVLMLIVIPLGLTTFGSGGATIAASESDLSRLDYLLTQFRVIVTYLRLLVLPINQMFDYDYPVYHSLLVPQVAISATLLLLLALLCIVALVRGRREGPSSPLLTLAGFGGLWFFITLSVESSVIPITDVIFEHRLYLPSVGIFMAAASVSAMVYKRVYQRLPRTALLGAPLLMLILCIALITATSLRNRVWSSPLSLWEDVVRKSPLNARAHSVLGIALIDAHRIDEAIVHFQKSIAIKPDYADGVVCLGNAYMEKGLPDEGYRQYQRALAIGKMDFESRAQLFMNIGAYFYNKGEYDQAIYNFQDALTLTPASAIIYHNLSLAYRKRGNRDEADAADARAKQLNPDRY